MDSEIFYYYLRDEFDRPYGCVAIKENGDGTIKRGVSICSKEDNFSKSYARALALKRLNLSDKIAKCYFKIYFGENGSCPLENMDTLPFLKWERNAKPTERERRILTKPSDR